VAHGSALNLPKIAGKSMHLPANLQVVPSPPLSLALALLDHDGRDAKGAGPHGENPGTQLAAFAQLRDL
jgi:hypothetical protein